MMFYLGLGFGIAFSGFWSLLLGGGLFRVLMSFGCLSLVAQPPEPRKQKASKRLTENQAGHEQT